MDAHQVIIPRSTGYASYDRRSMIDLQPIDRDSGSPRTGCRARPGPSGRCRAAGGRGSRPGQQGPADPRRLGMDQGQVAPPPMVLDRRREAEPSRPAPTRPSPGGSRSAPSDFRRIASMPASATTSSAPISGAMLRMCGVPICNPPAPSAGSNSWDMANCRSFRPPNHPASPGARAEMSTVEVERPGRPRPPVEILVRAPEREIDAPVVEPMRDRADRVRAIEPDDHPAARPSRAIASMSSNCPLR